MKTKHQLVAEVTALRKELDEAKRQIHFLQGSIHSRNMMTDLAIRRQKVAEVSYAAVKKLYEDG